MLSRPKKLLKNARRKDERSKRESGIVRIYIICQCSTTIKNTREIEDPEKQRKMEERENRREKKKQQPKMKQLKVKAM